MRQPAKFWTREAKRAGLARAVEKGARMEGAVREVVRRRETERLGKLSGSTLDWVAPEQGRDYLGRRTRRQAHAHLSATASRSLPLRECAETEQHQKGDRVIIYLPNIPEAAIAMLACARIGAVHSVVFGGFSSDSIRDRIIDSGAIALVTADGSYRRGGIVPLKKNVDDALRDSTSMQARDRFSPRGKRHPHGGRPRRLVASGTGICGCKLPGLRHLDSEHPLYLLYTSGSTGKPKGILHTTGGYLVGVYCDHQIRLRYSR